MKTINQHLAFTIVLIISTFMQLGAQNSFLASNASATTITKSDTSADMMMTNPSFRFVASSFSEWLDKMPDEDVKADVFGKEIAKKRLLMNQMYLTKVAIAPGESATKTVFIKPEIYFSTKKIEKFLSKSLKNGKLTPELACNAYNKVLDVVINISNEDTDKFEKRLSATKGDGESLLNIYLYEVKLE